MTTNVLVIVPCGMQKVWERDPDRGPVPAREAYTGVPFRINRAYAERRGGGWVILSAKYGFLSPDAMIPGPYNVTFKRPCAEVVSVETLRKQVREQGLHQFDEVISLGGSDYRAAITAAFAGTDVRLAFPFAGLPIGKAMQATKVATAGLLDNFERHALPTVTKGEYVPVSSKYQPLCDHLASLQSDHITLRFARIDELLGDPLPPSARALRTWWANTTNPSHRQAHAWMSVGWRVDEVDLSNETVTFKRA